jgi:hypothetical protein
MSVKHTIKVITLAGAASMIPGMASAANPAFGSWTATDGTGIAGCPTGFTCEVINSGDGFRQANVTDNSDPTNVFIQTLITDVATGCDSFGSCAFSDENFVKTDNTSTGIAGRQSTNDASVNFTSSVEINTGWALAAVPTPTSVDITQGLSDDPDGTASSGDEFTTSFNLQVNLDGSGVQTGRTMDITQDVGLASAGSPTDNQQFEVRERSGDLQQTPGSATLAGDTVDWVNGDDVMVTWVSQDVDIGSTGSSLFAFQSVENKDGSATTATDLVSDFSTTSNDPTNPPFDWAPGSDVETTFGSAP